MTKQSRKNKLLYRIIPIVLTLIMAFAAFGFMPLITSANANSNDSIAFVDFAPRELGIENPRFATSTGTSPSAPSGWEAYVFPNTSRGATISGVIDITEYNSHANGTTVQTNARLNEFAEFASVSPQSIRPGQVAMADGENRFLMINTTPDGHTAAGYASSTVTLNANGFFRISAWVASNFNSVHGASIRLVGIEDHNVAFSNIHTSVARPARPTDIVAGTTQTETILWQQYTFFVQTSAIRAENINLRLAVGDYYRGYDVPNGQQTLIGNFATGYALFDLVEAYEISPTAFYNAIDNHGVDFATDGAVQTIGRTQFVDLSLPEVTVADIPNLPNLDLSNRAGNMPTGWNLAVAAGAGINFGDLVAPFHLDTAAGFNPDTNRFNLSTNPLTPHGLASGKSEIFVLSTLASGRGEHARYRETAVGIQSPYFTIEQFAHYRLSVWVNTNNITGGAGASMVVTTDMDDINAGLDNDGNPIKLSFVGQALSGDPSNESRHGWSQHAMYIRGSFFRDYDISVGLWLGQEDNLSGGTAMFADLRLEKLTGNEFAFNMGSSVGGSPVDIDGMAPVGNIVNGNFIAFETIADNPQDRFPLTPSGWMFNTPATINRVPFSQDISFLRNYIDNDGNVPQIITGIIPTNPDHFWAHRQHYGPNVIRPIIDAPSVLYISSTVPTAFNYTSSPFTLPESSTSVVTVNMMVDSVPAGDYGASLVLLDENGVIATLQNITNTNGRFVDFNFYLESDEFGRNLTVEIWLGLHERAFLNRNKLSRGNIYVSSVDITNVSPAVFASRLAQNRININTSRTNRTFAAVTYNSFGLDEFDAFDAHFVRFPYLWSISGPAAAPVVGVRSGIFDSANLTLTQDGTGAHFNGNIPTHFNNADARGEDGALWRNNVLLLEHSSPTASRLSFDRPIGLDSESYYRLDVSMKVDIPNSDGAGAGISINDDFYFTNISSRFDTARNARIMDTAEVVGNIVDNTAFKTFSFFIQTGDSAESLQLAITLGGETPSLFSMGRVYVNHIGLEQITPVDFLEEVAAIPRNSINLMEVRLGEVTDTGAGEGDVLPDTRPPGVDAFMVPMILFSVLLLLVLAIIIVKRIGARVAARNQKAGVNPKKASKRSKARYDRNTVVEGSSVDSFNNVDSITDADEIKVFEDFDDSAPVIKKESKSKKPTGEVEVVAQEVTKEPQVAKTETAATEDFVDGFDD